MKQALIAAKEIQAISEQMHGCKKYALYQLWKKQRDELIAELKEYCGYRSIEFDKLRAIWDKRVRRGKGNDTERSNADISHT